MFSSHFHLDSLPYNALNLLDSPCDGTEEVFTYFLVWLLHCFLDCPKAPSFPCLLLYTLRKGMKARQFGSGLSLQAQAQNKPTYYLIFHTCVAMKPTASKQSVRCKCGSCVGLRIWKIKSKHATKLYFLNLIIAINWKNVNMHRKYFPDLY